MSIDVRPIAGSLGSEIGGVDLSRPLDDATYTAIRRVLVERQVIFFRDQAITPEQQIALTARFGAVSRVPYVEAMAEHPDIIAVLKEADEVGISTFGGTWHTDFSFLETPPLGSVLFAHEVPGHGGDTLWANQYAAYESLSDAMKATLDPLVAIHTGAPHGTKAPPSPDLKLSKSIKMRRGDPAADIETEHPVVRDHPESGRKALFVNPVYTIRFKDMTVAESRPLLAFLFARAIEPAFTCRFRWRAGSRAIWDNRCTQHFAINDYDGQRRLMHRTTIAGERPIGPG